MKDPMKPLAPTMADELDNLERVRQYMSARDYQDYIEKRALEALVKYRKHHNLKIWKRCSSSCIASHIV
jgi:hypothetical protein